jgi:hypothetical protein
MSANTEFGDLCWTIGWSMRELADRLGCGDRKVRSWASYQENEAGERIVGREPPPQIMAWLRFLANTITANPPPTDWRLRRLNLESRAENPHDLD